MSDSINAATVAVVTGANRGIGRALVDALLARGVARVYAGARRPETLADLAAAHGGRVVALALDVTDDAQVAAAAARASDATLVLNNAGLALGLGDPLTAPHLIPQLREQVAVNVEGVLRMTAAFAPVLAKNGGGAIANIGSVASLTAFPPFITYSVSKAAVHSLTQATRAHLAGQGTAVHGVYPGPIDTDMAKDLPMDKTSPRATAEAILDGITAGEEEIYPDPFGQQIGAAYATGPKALERQMAGASAG